MREWSDLYLEVLDNGQDDLSLACCVLVCAFKGLHSTDLSTRAKLPLFPPTK